MRAVEAAEPEHPALAALREGLEHYFSATGMAVDLSDAMCVELHRIREIREGIANRIEADLAILDAIDGTADLEDGGDDEPSLGALLPHPNLIGFEGFGGRRMMDGADQRGWAAGSTDDREAGDDNGIADAMGDFEQRMRFLDLTGRDFGGAR
ncbi:hypothetical protein [Methylobacterium terrae]|nr:hypothetical protein [Methylobacterium terrae]